MNKRLRHKLSHYLLQKELKHSVRKTQVLSFDKIHTISILYDATVESDYEIMKSYVRQLMSQSKDVVALGYFNRKELPNTRFMKLGLDFYTRKSLNFLHKPHHPIVTNFINRQSDLLIVFNPVNSIHFAYIANHVNSKFKIGWYDKKFTGLFDFMIKPEEDLPLKKMIEQVNHYLNLIRNENVKEA
jgi:hypothetical protein